MSVRGVLTASALALLTGCGASAPPTVTVNVAGRSEQLAPTQLCLDGTPQFYDAATRPVLRVDAGQRISIDVTEDLAASGWQVQIFDRDLQTKLGQVDAGNATTFADLSTSDPFPATYFLVVVQDAGQDCDGLSGAWPIGFIRGDGADATAGTPSSPTPTPTR